MTSYMSKMSRKRSTALNLCKKKRKEKSLGFQFPAVFLCSLGVFNHPSVFKNGKKLKTTYIFYVVYFCLLYISLNS